MQRCVLRRWGLSRATLFSRHRCPLGLLGQAIPPAWRAPCGLESRSGEAPQWRLEEVSDDQHARASPRTDRHPRALPPGCSTRGGLTADNADSWGLAHVEEGLAMVGVKNAGSQDHWQCRLRRWLGASATRDESATCSRLGVFLPDLWLARILNVLPIRGSRVGKVTIREQASLPDRKGGNDGHRH